MKYRKCIIPQKPSKLQIALAAGLLFLVGWLLLAPAAEARVSVYHQCIDWDGAYSFQCENWDELKLYVTVSNAGTQMVAIHAAIYDEDYNLIRVAVPRGRRILSSRRGVSVPISLGMFAFYDYGYVGGKGGGAGGAGGGGGEIEPPPPLSKSIHVRVVVNDGEGEFLDSVEDYWITWNPPPPPPGCDPGGCG